MLNPKQFFSLGLLLFSISSFGTHLRGGYITAERINCSLEFKVTLHVYVNTNPSETDVKFGSGILSFGDGNTHSPPTVNSIPQPGQAHVGLVEYSFNYTYAAPGVYTISYRELNRNRDIINMTQSINLPFYIETQITIDPFVGCYQTPVLLTPAVFTTALLKDKDVAISYAATSPDDILFQYDLVNPLTADPGGIVFPAPYTFPENASINTFNGLFNWDAKYQGQARAGEYAFAIQISHWKKKDDGTYIRLGHTLVDTQIILEDILDLSSFNPKDDIEDNGRLYVPSGETKSIKVIYKSFNNNEIVLNVYSELVDIPGAVSFQQYDSSTNMKVGILTVNSQPALDRDEPYIITLRGTEEPYYFPTDINLMFYTRDVEPQIVVTSAEDNLDWSVYPNPVTDRFFINTSSEVPVSIQVFDRHGRKVQQGTNNQYIDVSSLSNGLYFVELKSSQRKKIVKLLKR
jgi:hypothetical protein